MNIIETTTPAEAARDIILPKLRAALLQRGEARLLVSGGSSPKALFALLADSDLDWENVKVGLVDERIEPSARNADFVCANLKTGKASEACFVPMIKPSPRKDSREANLDAYRELIPADVCVLGMGTDGHTASWFPGSIDMHKAMDETANKLIPVVGVNTEGCEGNSGHDLRLTLTRNAVVASDTILLFIPGAEKRMVFMGQGDSEAAAAGEEELPVHSLRDLPNLVVVCDPAPA